MRRYLPRLVIAAAVLAVAAGCLGAALALVYRDGPAREEITLIVPNGATLRATASLLATHGVIRQPALFQAYARLAGASGALKAGEYAFPPGTSMHDALARLVAGDVVLRQLTVPEGLSVNQVLTLLAEAPGLIGDPGEDVAEGSLLPETYHYTHGDDRRELVRRMQAAMTATLAELWESRAEGVPLASPAEALILASIVEKETGLAHERPLVAGVFVNRLRAGLPLQSDPTVAYVVSGGNGVLDRPLTRTDLGTESPYNTYRRRGLPPGPIANPGRAAIAAVLDPANTDALYFVADGTGGHAFARDLESHNRNVRAWRRWQREQRQSAD